MENDVEKGTGRHFCIYVVTVLLFFYFCLDPPLITIRLHTPTYINITSSLFPSAVQQRSLAKESSASLSADTCGASYFFLNMFV